MVGHVLYGSIGFMLVGLVLAKYLTVPQIALHYYLVATVITAISAYSLLKYDDVALEANKDDEKFSLIEILAILVEFIFNAS